MEGKKGYFLLITPMLLLIFSMGMVGCVGAKNVENIGYTPDVSEGDKIQINNYIFEIQDISNKDTNNTTPHINVSYSVGNPIDDEDITKRINETQSKSFEDVTITLSNAKDDGAKISLDPSFEVWDKYPAEVDEFIFDPVLSITEATVSEEKVEIGDTFYFNVSVLNGGDGIANNVSLNLVSPDSDFEVISSPDDFSISPHEEKTVSFKLEAPSDLKNNVSSFELSAYISEVKDELGSSRSGSIYVGVVDNSSELTVFKRVTELDVEASSVVLKKGEEGEVSFGLMNINSSLDNGVAKNLELKVSEPSFIKIVSSKELGFDSLGVGETNSKTFELTTINTFDKDFPLTGNIDWTVVYENVYGELKEASCISSVTVTNESILLSNVSVEDEARVTDSFDPSISLENAGNKTISDVVVQLSSSNSSAIDFSSKSLLFGKIYPKTVEEQEIKITSNTPGNYTITYTIESSIGKQVKSFDVEFTPRDVDVLSHNISVEEEAKVSGVLNSTIKLENTDDTSISDVVVQLSSSNSSAIDFSSKSLLFGKIYPKTVEEQEIKITSNTPGNYTITYTIESSIGKQVKSYDIEFVEEKDSGFFESLSSYFGDLSLDGVKKLILSNPLILIPVGLLVGIGGWVLWRKRQYTYK